ncbi:hypothetical protein [Burkholderia sp. Ac-20344]|uniref:hypothetical protein n=1 Tax=Burkholderia sp. Ac-20344 TaxID=2703890 RepID=UPI001F119DD5|nr:hypothetical protein [Burkholderia sp. Ac-20344]
MYKLNNDTLCASSGSPKGRLERMHLMLQARLVKALRLRGISTVANANASTPSLTATYNARFTKPPRSDFNAHRSLRDDENLDRLMTRRETRRVSRSPTALYDCVPYPLDDKLTNRNPMHRYIDVWQYPDGRADRNTSQ